MIGWAKTAICETILHERSSLLLEKDRHRNQGQKRDGPHELVLPPTLPPENMKDLVNRMDDAIQSPGTADEKQAPPLDQKRS